VVDAEATQADVHAQARGRFDRRRPRLSVVIPSYRSEATLPGVLAALASQVRGGGREVVVVDSSADGSAARICAAFPWVRLIELDERTLPGRARNLGALAAGADCLAFIDADVVPEPGCLDELERRLAPGVELVVGAVSNGTPRSPTGTAGYLLEFLDFAPFRRTPPKHAVGCVLLVRRSAFERVGGFPEDLWPAEDTVFSLRVTERTPLAFVQVARVAHLNRRGLRPYLAHQRVLGASFALASRHADLPGRRFASPPFVFVAGLLRLVSLGARVWRHPRVALATCALAPWIVLGLAAWSVGAITARSS
jgi:glycosyltransferase involved in cell wall biosynthesis